MALAYLEFWGGLPTSEQWQGLFAPPNAPAFAMLVMSTICLLAALKYGRAPHPYDLQAGGKGGPVQAFLVLGYAGTHLPVIASWTGLWKIPIRGEMIDVYLVLAMWLMVQIDLPLRVLMSPIRHKIKWETVSVWHLLSSCLLYTSPSPRDRTRSRMPSSA